MTTPTVLPADLLSQLSELIAATETASVATNKWGEMLQLLQPMGYGPRITPRQIASLVSDARDVAESATTSQEVPAPTAAPKSTGPGKRRIILEDDKAAIRHAHTSGDSHEAISRQLGYSKSAIESFLQQPAGGTPR